MTVTFFGHRDAPQNIKPKLETLLIELIEAKNADTFYVGNNGSFDIQVRTTLKKLKKKYTHITYAVVLAYLPYKRHNMDDFADTIFPEELELVSPKAAIPIRNCWMIKKSDMVITYVVRTVGGASQFKSIAEKEGKTVINIADYNN